MSEFWAGFWRGWTAGFSIFFYLPYRLALAPRQTARLLCLQFHQREQRGIFRMGVVRNMNSPVMRPYFVRKARNRDRGAQRSLARLFGPFAWAWLPERYEGSPVIIWMEQQYE